ncbi:MAG: hypothetical protein K2Y23_15915 [Cyanobacteria bacterium]|nr:hypothetical protein [Cyanobacteriota bacterium]
MPERQNELFGSGGNVSGVLIDSEIQQAVDLGLLISRDTFHASSLEASSYDIRVGRKGIVGGEGVEIDLQRETLELGPGSYGGIISYEKLHLPDYVCARIGSKRALSYDGVILLTGATVDPGYEGHLLFGIYNASQRKVIVRHGRKLCNVVFERLAKPPEKIAAADPSLRHGNFPDAFLDRMANMEVLPWMQISERVKQIEQITKDILDLRARYDDVLQPIRDLTANVNTLTQDVSSLTAQTKSIAKDVDSLNTLVTENSRQIAQLATTVATISGAVQSVTERTRGLEDIDRTRTQAFNTLQTSFGRFQLVALAFWTLVILVLGAALPSIIERVWPRN